jgi:hypothetical protein
MHAHVRRVNTRKAEAGSGNQTGKQKADGGESRTDKGEPPTSKGPESVYTVCTACTSCMSCTACSCAARSAQVIFRASRAARGGVYASRGDASAPPPPPLIARRDDGADVPGVLVVTGGVVTATYNADTRCVHTACTLPPAAAT